MKLDTHPPNPIPTPIPNCSPVYCHLPKYPFSPPFDPTLECEYDPLTTGLPGLDAAPVASEINGVVGNLIEKSFGSGYSSPSPSLLSSSSPASSLSVGAAGEEASEYGCEELRWIGGGRLGLFWRTERERWGRVMNGGGGGEKMFWEVEGEVVVWR